MYKFVSSSNVLAFTLGMPDPAALGQRLDRRDREPQSILPGWSVVCALAQVQHNCFIRNHAHRDILLLSNERELTIGVDMRGGSVAC